MQNQNLKYLRPRKCDLKTNSTCAEVLLWNFLKWKQLQGRTFRRQYWIDNSCVDFFCCSENLIIELNGARTSKTKDLHADLNRDAQMKALGFYTLRIENEYVFSNPIGVLELIAGFFNKNRFISQESN